MFIASMPAIAQNQSDCFGDNLTINGFSTMTAFVALPLRHCGDK